MPSEQAYNYNSSTVKSYPPREWWESTLAWQRRTGQITLAQQLGGHEPTGLMTRSPQWQKDVVNYGFDIGTGLLGGSAITGAGARSVRGIYDAGAGADEIARRGGYYTRYAAVEGSGMEGQVSELGVHGMRGKLRAVNKLLVSDVLLPGSKKKRKVFHKWKRHGSGLSHRHFHKKHLKWAAALHGR